MAVELTCESCGARWPFAPPEMEAMVAALQEGNMERLRCPTCGISLARPLQRALKLPTPEGSPAPEGHIQRRHVRLPLSLPVTYERPGLAKRWGWMKNLTDGGLCLLSREVLAPSTRLRLEIHTQDRVHALEGVVVWNDAGANPGKSSIAHGIRFTGPVPDGFAVGLFLTAAAPPPA